MPDPRFFSVSEPKSLSALCDIAGATIDDGSDPALIIKDVAALSLATEGEVSFLDNVKYKDEFLNTNASACVVATDYKGDLPDGVALLYSDTPYKSFALISQSFYPDQNSTDGTRHDAAVIDDTANLHPSVSVAAGAVVYGGAKIGAGTVIKENVVIGKNVEIGQGCLIEATSVISHSLIGDGVRVYPGCCIGQDGFGFAIDKAGFVKVPQLGRVIIGDGVQIGANTTIDRGAGPDTTIGQGTWIDNLVQIGHNVKIGNGCIIVAQVGISGSTVIEDYVVLAGQVGIAGHLNIGTGARIGAQSGVMRDVPAGEQHMGSPALPSRQFMRQTAYLNKAIKPKKKT